MAVLKGCGSVLKIGTVAVGQTVSISGPSMSVRTVEITSLADTHAKYMSTITDYGKVSGTLQYDPDDTAGQQSMTDLIAVPSNATWHVLWTDATPYDLSFTGILTSFAPQEVTPDNVLLANFEITITGTAPTLP